MANRWRSGLYRKRKSMAPASFSARVARPRQCSSMRRAAERSTACRSCRSQSAICSSVFAASASAARSASSASRFASKAVRENRLRSVERCRDPVPRASWHPVRVSRSGDRPATRSREPPLSVRRRICRSAGPNAASTDPARRPWHIPTRPVAERWLPARPRCAFPFATHFAQSVKSLGVSRAAASNFRRPDSNSARNRAASAPTNAPRLCQASRITCSVSDSPFIIGGPNSGSAFFSSNPCFSVSRQPIRLPLSTVET